MNFLEDPSSYYYSQDKLIPDSHNKGVYKDLSKTNSYSSIFNAGLKRLFGGY